MPILPIAPPAYKSDDIPIESTNAGILDDADNDASKVNIVNGTEVASSSSVEKHPNGVVYNPKGVFNRDPLAIRAIYDRGEITDGMARIMTISSVVTKRDRVIILLSSLLLSYAYGLDATIRYFYQTYSVSSFGENGEHSLMSTVNVLSSVVAAAAQPAAAKIADVFGRFELTCLALFFYNIGTIIQATSNSTAQFTAGAVIYELGFRTVFLLIDVIIADVTSTRSRVFFLFIPVMPFIINTWVAADVVDTVLSATTWKWGIGMWCIIYTVCSLPLMISLWWVSRRAKKQGLLAHYRTPIQQHGFKGIFVHLFWQLDVVGLILIVAIFGLILAPLTIAGGLSEKWRHGYIIAPLVIGFVCIPFFAYWEIKVARHPTVPFKLLRRTTVWAALGVGCLHNFCWYVQGDYIYTVLQVAFDFSSEGANRITLLYTFIMAVVGLVLGFVVYKVRRVKPFVVAGSCLFMVGFGLLIHYRGGANSKSRAGAIGAQVVIGFAAGLFSYPVQAILQTVVRHEYVAIVTGLYLSAQQIGSSLGAAVSGAIWTQILPKELAKDLAFATAENSTIVAQAYGNPLKLILSYPVGTPIRGAMIESYKHVQKLLCITAAGLVALLIGFTLILKDVRLNDKQNLAEDTETDKVSLNFDDSHEGEKEDSGIKQA